VEQTSFQFTVTAQIGASGNNMTTSSVSRVAPKVELDFTTASLDSRITFARTTSATNPATFVNSSGVTSAAANNAPRFDYNPITLVCRGLLIEQSRANVCLQSSNFATSWNASGSATIGVDAINSPDGTQNADKLIEFTNTGQHLVTQAIAVSSATSYTVSIYAKKGERESIALRLIGTSTYAQAYFNLLAGTVTPSTGTASIVAMPNGWYRCIITGTSDSTTTNIYVNIGQTATSTSISSYTGDGVSGVYIWGAQLEAGAFVTSYIPTTTTSLTRNADVATITGTNFSNWWQAGLGGATVTALPSTVNGTRPLLQFDDGTANEIIALRGNTTNPELYIVDGGTPQAQIDAGTIAANTAYSLTGWWQTNFCAARKDNGARVEDLTATIPTVTQARLGSDGTNYLNGHLATIDYYDQFSGQIYTRRKNKAVFTVI
jgi:hypothetical protein